METRASFLILALSVLATTMAAVVACNRSTEPGSQAAAARADADPCRTQVQPVEGKWGYARRDGFCEGVVRRDREQETDRPWEPIAFQPFGPPAWPSPGTRFRVSWPAVTQPVTLEASAESWRSNGTYRLDALVRGPHFDWATDVMRGIGVSHTKMIAKTTERIGAATETVYLPTLISNLDDDDEPLPPPKQYLLTISRPVIGLRDLAFTVTSLNAAGAPAGSAVQVPGVRQPLDRPMGGILTCTLDFAEMTASGLYRVQMTATNSATQAPLTVSLLIRKP